MGIKLHKYVPSLICEFRMFCYTIAIILLAQSTTQNFQNGSDAEMSRDGDLLNHLTSPASLSSYKEKDSYSYEITTLRTLINNPDLTNAFGRISYNILMQKGMIGIRFEFQEMHFTPQSYDGTCFPSFFMILKDDISTSPRCGNFTGNQQDIFAKEGSKIELLIVNQLPYRIKETLSWRILISQIPEINIDDQPLMKEEREYCGMKNGDAPSEDSKIVLPEDGLQWENITWVEESFYFPDCRHGIGCRKAAGSNGKAKNTKISEKIVNGREAKTWPWMAALGILKDGYFRVFCGAAIIGRQLIATAGHCVEFSYKDLALEDIVVAIRAHDLSKQYEYRREYISISKVMTHSEYHGIRYDMAIIELSRPLSYDEKCSSICLPWNTDNLLEGASVVITGWGLLHTHSTPSPKLQEASVRCIPNANCTANWIATYGEDALNLIEPSMMCCGGKSATCNGDSGSPVHSQGPDGRWVLAGLVSFGPDTECYDPQYVLSVNSRATFFMKWIALSLAKPAAEDIVTFAYN